MSIANIYSRLRRKMNLLNSVSLRTNQTNRFNFPLNFITSHDMLCFGGHKKQQINISTSCLLYQTLKQAMGDDFSNGLIHSRNLNL